MRCKFCGTTLPDHAKFCPGCGKEIDNDRERHESREASNIPEDAYYTNTNKKNSKRKRRHKKISVRFIVVYLIVVLTGGFCLYRMGFPEKVVEMLSKQSSVPDSKKEISQKSDKKKNNEKKTGKATTEKKKDKTILERISTGDTTAVGLLAVIVFISGAAGILIIKRKGVKQHEK